MSFPQQQQTQINLADEISGLSQLTSLRLHGVSTLQQQGGSSAGALSSLLSHLKHLDLWVTNSPANPCILKETTY